MDRFYEDFFRIYILPLAADHAMLPKEEEKAAVFEEGAGGGFVRPETDKENAVYTFVINSMSDLESYTQNTDGDNVQNIYESMSLYAGMRSGDIYNGTLNAGNVQNEAVYSGDAYTYSTDIYNAANTYDTHNIKSENTDKSNTFFESAYTDIFTDMSKAGDVYFSDKTSKSKNVTDILKNEIMNKNTTENKKNEFVINLGGITQNISNADSVDMNDIGEAVAQCIINALNTTAEGCYI